MIYVRFTVNLDCLGKDGCAIDVDPDPTAHLK